MIFHLGLGGEIFEYLCPLPRVSFSALASRSSWVSRFCSLSASSRWRRSACLPSTCFLNPSRAYSSKTLMALLGLCLGSSVVLLELELLHPHHVLAAALEAPQLVDRLPYLLGLLPHLQPYYDQQVLPSDLPVRTGLLVGAHLPWYQAASWGVAAGLNTRIAISEK